VEERVEEAHFLALDSFEPGHLLTNAHVVGAGTVQVTLGWSDFEERLAEFTDRVTDVAVTKN